MCSWSKTEFLCIFQMDWPIVNLHPGWGNWIVYPIVQHPNGNFSKQMLIPLEWHISIFMLSRVHSSHTNRFFIESFMFTYWINAILNLAHIMCTRTTNNRFYFPIKQVFYYIKSFFFFIRSVILLWFFFLFWERISCRDLFFVETFFT